MQIDILGSTGKYETITALYRKFISECQIEAKNEIHRYQNVQ